LNAEHEEFHPDDLRALALQLAAFTGVLEQRGQQIVQQTQEAAHRLGQTAQGAAASSERLTADAVKQFRQAAAQAVSDGMRQPMEEAGQVMQDSTQRIQTATGELEARMHKLGKALSAHAWKTFVASALASLAVIGVAVYMGLRTHQDLVRAEWTGQINAAIANGKLARCRDGGLCARAGKTWVRLDQ
jgi:hypothetical protein